MNTQKPVKSLKWMRTALFAVIAVTASGCNNEMPDAGNNNPDKQSGKMTIYAGTRQEVANTRVAYDDSQMGTAESKTLTWQADDQLTVVRMNQGSYVTRKDDYLYQGTDGATSGSFEGTEITDAGDKWAVYYPNRVEVNIIDGTATLPMTGQIQTGNGNTDHLRNHILLAATDLENITDNFNLEMKSSILKLELTNVPSSVSKLTNLVWMAETPTGTKSITLSFKPEAVDFAGNSTLTAYLSFMPQEMEVKAGGKFTVILTGDKTYQSEITIAAGKKYAAGMRYTAELDSWQEVTIMAFTVKVDENRGLDFSIPFPTAGTTPADITVNWGDGKEGTEVPAGTLLAEDDNFNYTYDNAGTYTITITSAQTDETQKQIPEIKFSARQQSVWNRGKLFSVDTPLLNMGTTDLSSCFSGCTFLKSIPEGLFDKNTTATNFNSCFSSNSSLQTIPERLFAKNTKATDFNSCFRLCNNLKSIPEGLFANNTKATNFTECFRLCNKLISIPEGLFAKNTEATNFTKCFESCFALKSIPEGLFANNTKATNFNSCFYSCYALESISEGLFANNTEATNFNSCFYECNDLKSIPEGLFANNTAATNFNSCFYRCYDLKSIPEGLFANNTEATDFNSCFYDCNALKNIPERLFANNTKATNFAACFQYCRDLQSIPGGLFANNTKATAFTYCFANCSTLKSIPEGLFVNNTEATNFGACFSDCKALESIPEGLFAKNLEATNFRICFSNCSNLVLNDKIFSTDESDINRFTGKKMDFRAYFQEVGSALASNEAGTAPKLWMYDSRTVRWDIKDCFLGADNLRNWDDIPDEWGGPKPSN